MRYAKNSNGFYPLPGFGYRVRNVQEGSRTSAAGPCYSKCYFSNGVLQTAFPVSFDQAWNSTLATLSQLWMPIVRTAKVVSGTISRRGSTGLRSRLN